MYGKMQTVVAAAVLGALLSPVQAANPGDVIITEIMYYPNSPQASGCPLTEWIEIYNTTDGPIDLTDWYVADEDGASGNLEPYTLPAHGIAVIIPRGNEEVGLLTKEQFAAAWGIPIDQIIQPTPLYDASGNRPTNLPLGGIVGHGLDNYPSANADPSDDLINTPFDPVSPCYYYQPLCAPSLPDNEVLLLIDSAGQIIDKVNFDDEPGNGWPFALWHGWSIMLDETRLNADDNDAALSWLMAVPGERLARYNVSVAPFTGTDRGSPGRIQGITPSTNTPPIVANQSVWAARNEWIDVTLAASDDGQPAPAAISFTIETLPAYGTLTDVSNGNHVITPDELPYRCPNNAKTLRYTNTGTCSDDAFTYHADDSELSSAPATVTLLMQCGDLIITEIMYKPASSQTAPRVVEWIEVYNKTDAPVDVSAWYLRDRDGRAGDWPSGTTVPARGVAVVVPPGSGSRTMTPAAYRTAWDGYVIPQIIQALAGPGSNEDGTGTGSGEITKSGLNDNPGSDGEDVRLIDSSGRVQDRVSYRAVWPWPVANSMSSIYLKGGSYGAAANDVPQNWALSVDCYGGAYGSLISGFFNKTDFGSPGYLEGVTPPSGNVPPTARSRRVGIRKETPTLVTLPACDDGNPGGPLTYTITSVAGILHGSLKDPGNDQVISTVPYTLVNNGNRVLYSPDPGYTSALNLAPSTPEPTEDTFTYSASDGEKASRKDGTVALVVQKGGLVITEIMSYPQNQARNDWQYYEIYNPTPDELLLNVVTTDNKQTHMLIAQPVPAGATRVVTSGINNGSRSIETFLDVWAPLAADQCIFVDATTWDKVASESDRLQILDENYELMDEVYFGASPEWPIINRRSSFYLKRVALDVIENDKGENWALSAEGVDQAYASKPWNIPPTSDLGSPGIIPMCFHPVQDTDGDGDVDVNDFATFQACFNGANNPWPAGLPPEAARKCGCLDHDQDRDVDVNDFAIFQACFNGPNRPATCP